MHKSKHSLLILGAVLLMVLWGNMLTDQGKVMADLLSYDFTYTSSDTAETISVMDTVHFYSLITNTGTQADTYYVTRTDSTPPEWLVSFCVGGICYPPSVTQAKVYLEPSETGEVVVEIWPTIIGQGKVKITVHSKYGNVSKSKTFLLNVTPRGPVTSQWGIVILILLIITSAMYLMFRKFKLVRQT